MRLSVAKGAIIFLKTESESLGWDDGVRLLARAEAVVSKGGALSKWGLEQSRARKALAESLAAAVYAYEQYQDVRTRFVERKHQTETDLRAIVSQNPRALSSEIRTHATRHAYSDEKAKMLVSVDHLDATLDNMDNAATEIRQLSFKGQESIQQIEQGIAGILEAVTKYLDGLEQTTQS